MNIEELKLAFNSAQIKRWHTNQTIGTQTNAHHQWGVAALLNYIVPDNPKLIVAGLFHDSQEQLTGDVPYPVKRKNAKLAAELDRLNEKIKSEYSNLFPQLSHSEAALLKIADRLEALIYSKFQLELGNNLFQKIHNFTKEIITELVDNSDIDLHCKGRISDILRMCDE